MRFIDMFCGMGTIRMGFEQAGHECVCSIEWDKHQRKIYSTIVPVFMKDSLVPIMGEENMRREFPWEASK